MVVKGEEEAFPPLATYLLVAARNHLLKEIQSAEVYEPRTEAGMVGKRFFADPQGSPSLGNMHCPVWRFYLAHSKAVPSATLT